MHGQHIINTEPEAASSTAGGKFFSRRNGTPTRLRKLDLARFFLLISSRNKHFSPESREPSPFAGFGLGAQERYRFARMAKGELGWHYSSL